jgi:hypothetical protein
MTRFKSFKPFKTFKSFSEVSFVDNRSIHSDDLTGAKQLNGLNVLNFPRS